MHWSRRLLLKTAVVTSVATALTQVPPASIGVHPLPNGDFVNITEDDTTIRGLTIQDSAYYASLRGERGAHFDAIQAFKPRGAYCGGLLSRVSVESCTISSEYSLQGITAFDGMFLDMHIVGNKITVASEHGITICGMLSGSVVDNVCNSLMRLLPVKIAGSYAIWVLGFDTSDPWFYDYVELQDGVQDLRTVPYKIGTNMTNFRMDAFQSECQRLGLTNADTPTIAEVAKYYGDIITSPHPS